MQRQGYLRYPRNRLNTMQMNQPCAGDCCRHAVQQMRAVNTRQERDSFLQPRPRTEYSATLQIPSFNYPRTITYPQAQKPFATHHANYNYYAMATQPDASGDVTWGTHHERHMGESFAPHHRFDQPQVGHATEGQSFFEDCLHYRPEEGALYNPLQRNPAQNSVSHSMNVLTRPYAPIKFPSPSDSSSGGRAVTAFDDIPIMPLVQTNVDTTQFEAVPREAWRKASLDSSTDDDEFATSPASTSNTSYGPFTPHDDHGFTDFAYRRLSSDHLSSSLETTGTSMFGDLGCDVSFSSVDDLSSSVGSQFSSQASHYGGLPFQGSHFGELRAPGINDLPLNQGPFRGIDGLPPSSPAVAPGSGECDGSGTSRAITKTKRRRSSEKQAEAEAEAISRDEKDQYLLDMREEGYTYKEIKAMGHFTEAESTLRGRVRVLTKDRSERVRKPVWTDRDVRIDPRRRDCQE